MIVATAGHVDHGKSTLVRLLTGTDPDRWDEERRRGLTIDLGFAWFDAADREPVAAAHRPGLTLAFVDVPGHRHFLSNMLAGCGVIDLALLVVSARESWMPQTEEHSQILHLLGVHHGVVALTHADLVDHDQVERARLEISGRLADTTLAGTPIVATAASGPSTIETLRAALVSEARAVITENAARTYPERPRVWIDRSFTLSGPGRVVTGTLGGGDLAQGPNIDVVGGQRQWSARVRNVHVNGEPQSVARPTARVGVDLAGSDEVPERGHALVHAGQWAVGRRWQVALRAVRDLNGRIEPRGGYQVFVGTAHMTAQLRYAVGELDRADASPGAAAGPVFARLHLSDALGPLSLGDRFIIRDEGRDSTLGGGMILAIDTAETRYRRDDLVARWDAITSAGPGPAGSPLSTASRDALAAVLVDQGGGAIDRASLERLVGPCDSWEALDLAPSPSGALGDGSPVAMLRGHAVRRRDALDRAAEVLAALARGDVVALAQDLLGRVVGEELVHRGLAHRRADQLAAPGMADHDSDLARALGSIAAALASAPTPLLDREEIRSATGLGSRPVDDLLRRGFLLRVGPFVTTPEHFQAMSSTVRATLAAGPAPTSLLRTRLGLSRKYAIPVLETLDAMGCTARDGDQRAWVPGEDPGGPSIKPPRIPTDETTPP